jgi:hypothetical protein
MVLGGRPPGRVGRRQIFSRNKPRSLYGVGAYSVSKVICRLLASLSRLCQNVATAIQVDPTGEQVLAELAPHVVAGSPVVHVVMTTAQVVALGPTVTVLLAVALTAMIVRVVMMTARVVLIVMTAHLAVLVLMVTARHVAVLSATSVRVASTVMIVHAVMMTVHLVVALIATTARVVVRVLMGIAMRVRHFVTVMIVPRRFDRDDRPRRDYDRPSRGPRPEGDRDARPSFRDRDDRPRRFDRDDRPSRGRFDRDDRPRRDDDRDSRPPRGRFGRDDRPRHFDEDRPRREDTRTAAQRRSDEVNTRTGGRRTTGEMSGPPDRTSEIWVDEGSTRPIRRPEGIRARGTGRAQKGGRKEVRALDSVVEEFERALGTRASVRALKRYDAALQAFEAHRYEDARKILNPMAKEYTGVSAVHEMLGLCLYRGGQWKRALTELETAVSLNPNWIFNHAVIEDCHRALGNHQMVEKYWRELAEASPHPELLAEGRIVMAGSLSDRKLFEEAHALMEKAAGDMKRPSEYHLRQWFVIADIYDKQGNVIQARNFFERIALHDRQFVDVAERLATLGA